MSIEKMYCNESRKSLSQQLLLEVSIFRFHFISALQYLYCYNNEYLMKQTASLYWSFLWNLHFMCFCNFWKDNSLLIVNLYISEYLDQIRPWKEVKEAFSVKIQTENLCFCLRKRLHKTQSAQIRNIMQSSTTFIRISRLIPEVKNPALINDWENTIYYREESCGPVA